MDVVVFSLPANLRNWKYEARFIFDIIYSGFNAANKKLLC